MNRKMIAFAGVLLVFFVLSSFVGQKEWQSKYVKLNKNRSLTYIADEKGNIIPDFSRVGYYGGDKEIPDIPVVKTIEPAVEGTSETIFIG